MATKSEAYGSLLSINIVVLLATILSFGITGIVYGQGNSLPFEFGEIPAGSQDINPNTPSNTSNLTDLEQNGEVINCEMPPCPPGQACIQSCPEVTVQ